jgi:hypothetical protein
MVLLPQTYVALAGVGYSVWATWWGLRFQGESWTLNVISFLIIFYYNQRVDTSAGGLLIPGDIIRPVVASSSLTLSIICTMYYYRNLEFPNHIAIIKSTVLLHQSYVTCWLSCLGIWFTNFQRLLYYVDFQCSGLECTCWRLFQKCAVDNECFIALFCIAIIIRPTYE